MLPLDCVITSRVCTTGLFWSVSAVMRQAVKTRNISQMLHSITSVIHHSHREAVEKYHACCHCPVSSLFDSQLELNQSNRRMRFTELLSSLRYVLRLSEDTLTETETLHNC